MSALDIQPYLLPRAELVRPGGWHMRRAGVLVPLPESLPEWDFALPIELECAVEVDLEEVLRECDLGRESSLALAVVWRSTSTRLSGLGTRVILDPARASAVEALRVELASQFLGGTLVLETQLVLLRAGAPAGRLSAHRPGSILWRGRAELRLEGESPRFPVEMIDFGASGVAPERAGWYLDWRSEDLQDAALGSLVLYLNSRHPVIARVAADPSAGPEARTVMSALELDVARQLTERALDSADLVMTPGVFPAGTLGDCLQRLVSLYWPGVDLESLRTLRRERPGEFSARLQSRLSVFIPPGA